MKTEFHSKSISIRRIIIAIAVLIAFAVFLAAAAFWHFILSPLNRQTERPDYYTIGTKWTSEDGNISFSAYEKMVVFPAEAGSPAVLEYEYFAMGSIADDAGGADILCRYFQNNAGTCYITFIESEQPLDLSEGKVSVSYTGKKLAELKIKSFDENKFSAVVTYADPAQGCFTANETICFTQTNDLSGINPDDYRLYFDGAVFGDKDIFSNMDNVDIMLYTKEEFCKVYGLDAKSLTSN